MRRFLAGAGLMMAVSAGAQTNEFTVTNIVTNSQDARLVNPWGLSRRPKISPNDDWWWAADEASGVSTLYAANGSRPALVVTVPPSSGDGAGSPTGTVNNSAAGQFAFATLDGTLSVWDAKTKPSVPGKQCYECHVGTATIAVNNAAAGASYQGLAIATNATSHALTYYVANANGTVEAYDAASFSRVTLQAGAFTDSQVPASYTPAGIQAIGSEIFVTFNASAGGGTGFVDAFDTNGNLLVRLENGWFNQPWGVVLAPAGFGSFGGDILIGNTGSGWIGAYKKGTGKFAGYLQSGSTDLFVPGLWGLSFGSGSTQSGPTDVLYFTAGGANQTTGVFGAIAAN